MDHLFAAVAGAIRCSGWIANSEENRAAGTGFNFAIIRPGDDMFLGGCNLWIVNHNDRIANLSYWVRTSQTGQGLATQVVRQAAMFAFQQVGLLRLEIVVAEPNLASQRVAEKSGAVREGLLRNRITIHGKTYDAWMFSLIPSDFEEISEFTRLRLTCSNVNSNSIDLFDQCAYISKTAITLRIAQIAGTLACADAIEDVVQDGSPCFRRCGEDFAYLMLEAAADECIFVIWFFLINNLSNLGYCKSLPATG